MDKKQIIIIPDIHGRTFWKKAKDFADWDIIFLGDYLDPYPWEKISPEDCIINFEEIIGFKEQHPDNVTLLLGNHDMEYFIPYMEGCRMIKQYKNDIRDMFIKNKPLFQIGTYREIDNKKYSFTHSCILKKWLKDAESRLDFFEVERYIHSNMAIPDIINSLNEYLQKDPSVLHIVLNMISWNRGGNRDYASPVWADLSEINSNDYEFNEWYQIFGHTQQFSKEMVEAIKNGNNNVFANPVITPFYSCLDCKQLFILSKNKVSLF